MFVLSLSGWDGDTLLVLRSPWICKQISTTVFWCHYPLDHYSSKSLQLSKQVLTLNNSCGDGEFIIYTAIAWRNQGFGAALDFAWGWKDNNSDYAIRESPTSVKIFRKFKEKPGGLDVGFQAEGLSGGTLLGVKGQGGIGMFDWETGSLVRRIEVEPREVYWSEAGELVALACADTTYILRFNREAYLEGLNAGLADEDGVEAAFEVVADINEAVRSGFW